MVTIVTCKVRHISLFRGYLSTYTTNVYGQKEHHLSDAPVVLLFPRPFGPGHLLGGSELPVVEVDLTNLANLFG